MPHAAEAPIQWSSARAKIDRIQAAVVGPLGMILATTMAWRTVYSPMAQMADDGEVALHAWPRLDTKIQAAIRTQCNNQTLPDAS